jgi:hypothetical protein
MLILNSFRKVKSLIEFDECIFVLLPDNDVLEIIIEIADFHEMTLLLNLAWFLTNQMEFRRLMITAIIVTFP